MDKLSNWLSLEMKADKTAKIKISGYIGVPEWWQHDDNMAEEVVSTKEKMSAELEKLANLKASVIEVEIDSFGGDVNHGLSIYNALATNPAKIIINYTGWSASIATVIAAAGEEVNAPSNLMLLVHEGRGVAMGTKEEIERYSRHLDKVNSVVADIYAAKGGQDKEVYSDLMAEANGEGEWRLAEDFQELGLVDNIIEPLAAVASFEDQMIKAKEFGLNINTNTQMGILSKKAKQVNQITLGEVNAIYEGDLKTGLQMVGVGAEVVDGTFEVDDNEIVIENSIVKSITPKTPEMVTVEAANTMVAEATESIQAELDQANEELATMTTERDELQMRVDNLEKLTSNHKPKKKDGVSNDVQPDITTEINMIVKDQAKKTAESVNKKRRGE